MSQAKALKLKQRILRAPQLAALLSETSRSAVRADVGPPPPLLSRSELEELVRVMLPEATAAEAAALRRRVRGDRHGDVDLRDFVAALEPSEETKAAFGDGAGTFHAGGDSDGSDEEEEEGEKAKGPTGRQFGGESFITSPAPRADAPPPPSAVRKA